MHRIDFRFLRLLYLFVTVAEVKNFSKAAQILCMSQPPLSQSIKDLEKEVGYSLFERHARGVRLTSAGKSLFPIIKRFVSEAEVLSYSIKNMKPEDKTFLSVASVYDGMVHVIPYLMKEISKVDPNVNLFTKEVDSIEIPQLLLSGEVNFCIGYNLKPLSSELEVERICTVDLKAAVSTSSKFVKKTSVSWSDLAREPLVVIGREVTPAYYDHIFSFFLRNNLEPSVHHTVNSLSRQMAFINCGQGVGIVPAWETQISPKEVKLIKIEDDDAKISLNLSWKKGCETRPMQIFFSALAKLKKEKTIPIC